ncbi:MAG: glycosyltransferase family 2 protein [Deltaproteobacteria bacterium]|nr:glycosyltransferase family 2 protein [Deltaproteobacteria bacterium]
MNLSNKNELISVCICTFKREKLLRRAIESIIYQKNIKNFKIELVIVDNDKNRSGEKIVKQFASNTDKNIYYYCENIQNISMARNRAICSANGNYIAFIDDDEFATPTWLNTIYYCLKTYNAHVVLGPVLPDYPDATPKWLIESRLCERNRRNTGKAITNKDMRTGNIIFKKEIFDQNSKWFDFNRGLTGGEDVEFLERLIGLNKKIIWCDEAVVYERISDDRLNLTYYLQRHYRIGTISGTTKFNINKFIQIMKSLVLICLYTTIFPFTLFVGKHRFAIVLSKIYYFFGFISSSLNLNHPLNRVS